MARSKSNKPKKSTAGMRRNSDGKIRYSAKGANGRFISRNTTERVYYSRNGKLIKAGIGVARANDTTGRKTQAKGGQTIEAQQYAGGQEINAKKMRETDLGDATSLFTPETDIVDDIYDEPVLHDPFSSGNTETLRYDNTNMGRWREKAKEYTDIDKPRSTDEQFIFDPAANAKYKLDIKSQEKIYQVFRDANKVVEEIRQLTDADMHEDVIAARFSYNMNVNPDILWRRYEAAEELILKGARQYVMDVAAKYRQDFISNFQDQFEAEDIKEFMEALEDLNDRQFLSVLKYASKSNLAYVIQSVIDEYGYEFALGEIRVLTQNFREYKTNKAFREDVKWKNWKKSD